MTGKQADREGARDPRVLPGSGCWCRTNEWEMPDGVAALHEPDAVLDKRQPDADVRADAIRAFHAGVVASGRKFELGDQRPAFANGDVALTSADLSHGIVTAEIARRRFGGTWRWAIDQPPIA